MNTETLDQQGAVVRTPREDDPHLSQSHKIYVGGPDSDSF